jgi:hypothetical protein
MTNLPISAPGVYADIDPDEYHSQRCCTGVSASSSSLRLIDRECPAKFWALSDLNKDHVVVKPKAAFEFGRAAHALVLSEPAFNSKFIISPYDDFHSKEAREWRDKQKRIVLKAEQMDQIVQMAQAQRASVQAMHAFEYGKAEMILIWQDEETGIWLKARPDWLPDDVSKRFAVEYKTARSIAPRQLSNAVFGFGYELQAALSYDAMERMFHVKPLGIAHVVQEKDPPYLTSLMLFTDEQIALGRIRYRRALQTLARCLKTNEWPGYTTEPTYFETPYWVLKEMEQDDGRHTDGDASGEDDASADE